MTLRVALTDKLTTIHKKRRRKWCRAHLQTNFDNWLFSDECSFELLNSCSVQRVFDEKFSNCCTIKAICQNRKRVMVWGYISSSGPGSIELLEKNIDASTYQQVFQRKLVPYLYKTPLNKRFQITFQHDIVPPHTEQTTVEALRNSQIGLH